jgi:hypothetical protein
MELEETAFLASHPTNVSSRVIHRALHAEPEPPDAFSWQSDTDVQGGIAGTLLNTPKIGLVTTRGVGQATR